MKRDSKMSRQMKAIVSLLEVEELTAKEVNDRLFTGGDTKARRTFAASMSRSFRRLRARGKIGNV